MTSANDDAVDGHDILIRDSATLGRRDFHSPAAITPWTAHTRSPLDHLLLAQFDPATSAAWAGAAPPGDGFDPTPTLTQLTFDVLLSPGGADLSVDMSDYAPFDKAGYQVRPIVGKGKATTIDRFVTQHHHSLHGGGMNGAAFGLYDPSGVLVGVTTFARPTNVKTAAGMQVGEWGDESLSPLERAHVTHAESETVDCTRLCVAERASQGVVLGTGAESFLFMAALRLMRMRNRALWRATRMVELGLPLPPTAQALLRAQVPYVKCVRTHATSGQRGVTYMACGLFYAGLGRVEREAIGGRSGELCGGRALTKLARHESPGHEHQVLRAVWEGSDGYAVGHNGVGEAVSPLDLAPIRRLVPDGLTPLARQAALKRAWHTLRTDVARATGIRAATWVLTADQSGYFKRSSAARHRYVGYLGTPYYALQLARRCKYLREAILAAEAVWFAPAARLPRGVGYNWRRRPQRLGARPYPPAASEASRGDAVDTLSLLSLVFWEDT